LNVDQRSDFGSLDIEKDGGGWSDWYERDCWDMIDRHISFDRGRSVWLKRDVTHFERDVGVW
jgi:hypothetical protein